MNWTDQAMHKSETSQKISNIDKVKMFCVLHDKVALLTRRRSEWGKTDCHRIIFRKVLTITYRKCWSKDEFFNGSDETDIRLPFHRSFSTFWNIFGGYFNSWWVFYSWAWVRGDVKPSVLWNGLFQKKTIRRCWGHKINRWKFHLLFVQYPWKFLEIPWKFFFLNIQI